MKNKYEIRGDITVIFLESKGSTYEVLIDTDDLELVKKIPRWNINKKNGDTLYVSSYKKVSGKNIFVTYIHRYIMGLEKGDPRVIDHINHNGLDNRKSNLRIVTVAENGQNLKSAQKGSRTGIRGLSWSKSIKKWQVRMQINKRPVHLGYYDSFEEAEKLAKEAYVKLMPYSQKDGKDQHDPHFEKVVRELVRNRPNKQNQSGIRGVYYHKASKKWVVKIFHRKSLYYTGAFETKEEAGTIAKKIRSDIARLYEESEEVGK